MGKKLKILWITNGIMPDMLEAMGKPANYGGSWLIEPSRLLASDSAFELFIATPWASKKPVNKKVNGISYYLIPSTYLDRMKRPSQGYRKACNELIERIRPDVIHLHGGEFAIGIPFAEYPGIPKVLSIQGIISKINQSYFYGGIRMPTWAGCFLPWNVLTYLPMKLQHARNKWRASSEIRQMKQVDAITGCTRWDYTYSMLINPQLKYFNVDYAIRNEFSQYQWSIEQCERHTFLIGSMTVPLKGLHKAFEALAILLKKYPDAKIKVVGTNTFQSKHRIGYSRYLYQLANKHGIMDHLDLLGPQDTVGMVKAMLSSHCFVLSSCIENGPNTMMEAMWLGLPCVCSYVGGAMQFAKENEEAVFYRFEEPEILAYELDRIWSDDGLAHSLSIHARERASKFESYSDVYRRYAGMYQELIEDK